MIDPYQNHKITMHVSVAGHAPNGSASWQKHAIDNTGQPVIVAQYRRHQPEARLGNHRRADALAAR